MTLLENSLYDEATPRQGRFVVFEGADGSGKTTVARRLCEILRQRGFDVLHVEKRKLVVDGHVVTK